MENCQSPSDQEARWETVRAKIARDAPHLRRQGSIVAKWARGRRVWALRFRLREQGRTVQRSVYLGGDDQPELLGRARDFLRQCRAQALWPGEVAASARMAAAIRTTLRRLHPRA
jgi:hypothetical protein